MKLPTRREILANTAAACSAAVVLPLIISKGSANASASDKLAVMHKVEIRKFKFIPDQLLVKAGDTIIWTNFDIAPHTATADDKSWDTEILKQGQSKSIVVSETMAIQYSCRFHPNMKAKLQIEQAVSRGTLKSLFVLRRQQAHLRLFT